MHSPKISVAATWREVMSARTLNVVEVVSRYAAGFFPLYDPWGRFYWERLPMRAVLPLGDATVSRARRMMGRAWKNLGRTSSHSRSEPEFRYTTAVQQVIAHLQDESIKENSWVREEVVRIYEVLHAAGLLQTVELWLDRGRGEELVGGLLGIVLPGTFVAETMFGLVPEASKLCVCRLILNCHEAKTRLSGAEDQALFEMIDVQTPHDPAAYAMLLDVPEDLEQADGRAPHPCVRLGEETLMLRGFMHAFGRAWRAAFPGGVEEWVAASIALQRMARGLPVAPGALPPHGWHNAYHLLRHNLPPDFRPAVCSCDAER